MFITDHSFVGLQLPGGTAPPGEYILSFTEEDVRPTSLGPATGFRRFPCEDGSLLCTTLLIDGPSSISGNLHIYNSGALAVPVETQAFVAVGGTPQAIAWAAANFSSLDEVAVTIEFTNGNGETLNADIENRWTELPPA